MSGLAPAASALGVDRPAKRARVLELLDRGGASAIVLRSHTAVAWYLDGARTHVSLAGEPVAAVVVRPDRDEVRVFANEAERLLVEELGDAADLDVVRVPWHEPLVPASLDALDEADATADLRAARAALLPGELARYRVLCSQVAEALTDAALAAEPSDTERDVAARLAADLVERGIDPLVTLVAGRSRLAHRHPLPTDSPVGDRAMLVVCGRRHGLIANATRWVRFGPADPGEADAMRRILDVEAAFLDATVPGSTLGDVFAAGTAGYVANGFDPDEWRKHHQGGAAGYAGRDPRAVPGASDIVQLGQAFAWNPTAPGAKVEDTVLIGPEGVEVLTVDPRWPTMRVAGRDRPVDLARPAHDSGAASSSPISGRVGQVFIPVRELPRAARWYATLLGSSSGRISHGDTICELRTEGAVGVALDANQPDFVADGPPRFFWWADDLVAVRAHLESLGVARLGEIVDIGSVSFIQFADPDGNRLMVCARN
ncbi:M24 family metallopeptidase [Agromyces sp. ZXT2-6]|uniref:M24 family metallopeptidase n=1 Tax=Agromyces sp. ZXT2-6 TaxID=3461153 RepID=UPI004054FC75